MDSPDLTAARERVLLIVGCADDERIHALVRERESADTAALCGADLSEGWELAEEDLRCGTLDLGRVCRPCVERLAGELSNGQS